MDQEVLASLEHPLARLVPVHLSVQDDLEDRPIRRNLDHLSAQVDPEDPRNHPYPGIKVSFVRMIILYYSIRLFLIQNKLEVNLREYLAPLEDLSLPSYQDYQKYLDLRSDPALL